MAREIAGGDRRLGRVVLGGTDVLPNTCDMQYNVMEADGVNDDLHEPPKTYNDASPNFNQTMTALCAAVVTSVKTNEAI